MRQSVKKSHLTESIMQTIIDNDKLHKANFKSLNIALNDQIIDLELDLEKKIQRSSIYGESPVEKN